MLLRSEANKTERLVMTALMMRLIIAATILLRIPVPMTQGYVHLGDAMVYLGVLVLGRKCGSAAAGLGSAMADVLGGYAFWAPWTFMFKFAMAYITGTMIDQVRSSGRDIHTGEAVPAMITGGLAMTAGYCVAERFMYGSWGAALIGVPWNTGQFVTGIILAAAIYSPVSRIRRIGKH